MNDATPKWKLTPVVAREATRLTAFDSAVASTPPMLAVQSNENNTSAAGGSEGSVTLTLLLVDWPGESVASMSAAITLPVASRPVRSQVIFVFMVFNYNCSALFDADSILRLGLQV